MANRTDFTPVSGTPGSQVTSWPTQSAQRDGEASNAEGRPERNRAAESAEGTAVEPRRWTRQEAEGGVRRTREGEQVSRENH